MAAARTVHTDDRVLAAVLRDEWDGLSPSTRTRWTQAAEEWAVEQTQAAAEKREPVPAGRVARLLAGAAVTEATLPARARAREALSLDEMRGFLGGAITQMIDHEVEHYHELAPRERHELLSRLLGRFERLTPQPAEGAAAGASPFLAIFNQVNG